MVKMTSTITWSLLGLLLAYGAMVGLIFVAQRNLMYLPDSTPPDLARSGLSGATEVTYPSSNNLVLRSWFVAARPDQPTLVYFQGNAGNIGDRADKIDAYLKAGFGVLLVGYRGYGGNPGRPDEQGLYADARAALDWLARQGIGAERTILYGESLGSGVAVRTAYELAIARTPVRGLVLEAPFTSMGAVAQDHYPYLPAKWLVKDRYPSVDIIGEINTSLLIIHGIKDRTVSVGHGKRLFHRARQPKSIRLFDSATHNDLYDFGADQEVVSYISSEDH